MSTSHLLRLRTGLRAPHDGGLAHHRDGSYVGEPGAAEDVDPGADGHGAFLQAQQVARGVLGDAPPAARAAAREDGDLGGDDLAVASVSAAAEHHVADDEPPAGP